MRSLPYAPGTRSAAWILAVLVAACGSSAEAPERAPQPVPRFRDTALAHEARVADLLERLTREEKLALVAGDGRDPGGDGFSTRAIPRLGIPSIRMADGPVGVRVGRSTAFPAAVAMAASWDTPLVERIGAALGREARGHGRQVLLGPCVNIHRVPQGGRNFESFGEDPHLAARMAVSYIRGVQSESVIATVKHFACNNQEIDRGHIDARVSERALREIYWPAFRAAVREANVGAVMTAYNKVNGAWCSENPILVNRVLKAEWGFPGFVVSDWHSVHGTEAPALAGLDLEMPGAEHFGAPLARAVDAGAVPASVLDDKVRRILGTLARFGLLDASDNARSLPGLVGSDAHQALAREAAAAGCVLLKNERSSLPLDPVPARIAVLGPLASMASTGGGGSSRVEPLRAVTALEALRSRLEGVARIEHVPGCELEADEVAIPPAHLRTAGAAPRPGLRGEYFANRDLHGDPAMVRIDAGISFDWGGGSPGPSLPADGFSVRWSGFLVPDRTGDHVVSVGSDDGFRLYLDGQLVIDHWSEHAFESRRHAVRLVAGRRYRVRLEYYEGAGDGAVKLGWRVPGGDEGIARAVNAAKGADVALVFVGLTDRFEREAFDREQLALPAGQDELIEAVAAANPRTVVILHAGSPVLVERWIGRVAAVLVAWYPGGEGGHAITDVLLGDVNPSGRLPMTFPRSPDQVGALADYPGDGTMVRYAEGVYVGYRHTDRAVLEPRFPFGHGLSYTAFAYRNAIARTLPDGTVRVTVEVGNAGTRAGSEIVQLYVAPDPSRSDRPVQELRAFQKVALEPGAWTTVAWTLGDEAFARWDERTSAWVIDPGRYLIKLGPSSRVHYASVPLERNM